MSHDENERPTLPAPDGAGRRGPLPEVGGYEILGPLGEGGMGTVWRAVQQSTRREVALKLLRQSALGSAKAQVRFEREVELAARLQHPHVARVYDSGLRHDVYYYAMELVEGLPLDQYVAQQDLTRHEILALMRTVCRAVQHAHQRGVIHRDLKPSNILVTHDGEPHVLDFGLAKALLEEGADVTVSVPGEVAGTPAYMSPEQAAGQTDEIDTRSDVYSLGVILFRLLTGAFPQDVSGPRLDLLRRIAEEEPRRPREVGKGIDRELDAVLLKALAREPESRYASAGDLADDIDNYVEGEPLSARAPTTFYFLRKRLRKYHGRVAVAALVLVSLIGLGVWSYVNIAQARDEEQQQADKATAVVEFIQRMISAGDPATARGRDVTVGELLYGATMLAGERFADQPLVEAAIREVLGNVYLNRGDPSLAHTQLSRALELRQRCLPKDHADTATAMHNVACALGKLDRRAEAERFYREALVVRRQVLGEEHPDTLGSMEDLSTCLRCQDRCAEAEGLCAGVLEIHRRVMGPEHPDTLRTMANMAVILSAQGRCAEAERLLRQVLEARRRVLRPKTSATQDSYVAAFGRILGSQRVGLGQGGADHPDTLMTMNDLACVLRDQEKHAEAEQLLREALAGQQRVLGPRHFDTVNSMNNLALVLADQGSFGEAEKMLRSVIEAHRALFGDEHAKTLKAMSDLAFALEPQGKYAEAERLLRQALEWLERTSGEEHRLTLAAMHNLATVLVDQQDYVEAEAVHRELLGRRRRHFGEDHRDTLETQHNLAVALHAQGKAAEAEKHLRDVLAARRRTLGAAQPETLLCQLNLATALCKQGKTAEAETLCRHGLKTSRRALGHQHPDTLYAMEVLAATLVARGKNDEANALREERESILEGLEQKNARQQDP
jgi:tetratricopeptide (TPR) repeat protein